MRQYSAGINEDIFSFVPERSLVLDVGCADGKFGAFLKKTKGCTVFGIEKNRKSAHKASKRLKKVFCTDIERPLRQLRGTSFDVIVLADVLEHTREPSKILKNFSGFLKQRGMVIVSVPNIANFFVRKDILLGKFEYAKEGILDENHLRFFTLKEMKKMLESTGYRIVKIKATRNALRNMLMQKIFQKVGLGAVYNKIDYSIANAWKSLFAQQFVVLAERVD
jgi:methionine biosynthesis protein MetW